MATTASIIDKSQVFKQFSSSCPEAIHPFNSPYTCPSCCSPLSRRHVVSTAALLRLHRPPPQPAARMDGARRLRQRPSLLPPLAVRQHAMAASRAATLPPLSTTRTTVLAARPLSRAHPPRCSRAKEAAETTWRRYNGLCCVVEGMDGFTARSGKFLENWILVDNTCCCIQHFVF